MMIQAVAIIPSRYGSTRFPGKPLAPIAGKPMIRRVYERACDCRCLREVYVATDDPGIASVVEGFGGKALMTRPSHRSGTDRICEAAEILGLEPDTIVVNIQGDQPAFPPSVIDDLVSPFQEAEPPAMTTLKFRFDDPEDIQNPNHVKVVTDFRGDALYFSRAAIPYARDGVTTDWYKHLGFYAYSTRFLKEFTRLPEGRHEAAEKLEQLRALEHGFKIRVVETAFESLEVDVPGDIPRIEAHLAAER
jgi:3-deoxy-manno-octulosonate cytidylyltransferase (CMP-KDO synthetase)